MWGREWWRRRTTSRHASTTPAERAAVLRGRLARLEVQRLELLADESIPGRKHRLDAVRAARDDLERELEALAADDDPPRVAAATAVPGPPGA